MNDPTIPDKTCTRCGKLKPFIKFAPGENYKCGRSSICNQCKEVRLLVTCADCGSQWQKEKQSIKKWNGRCRRCAQVIAVNEPQRKARVSALARAQVIKQGGIPNGHRFTKENKGANHNHWKGGISSENSRLRGTSAYKEWRTKVFQRDHYTCQHCGQIGGNLNADHIKPFAYYPDLRFELSNGQTLCVECHKKTPTYKRKACRMNDT